MKIEWKTEAEAADAGLVQHSIWLFDNKEELDTLLSMHKTIMQRPTRQTMFVKSDVGSRIALFVNDVTSSR